MKHCRELSVNNHSTVSKCVRHEPCNLQYERIHYQSWVDENAAEDIVSPYSVIGKTHRPQKPNVGWNLAPFDIFRAFFVSSKKSS